MTQTPTPTSAPPSPTAEDLHRIEADGVAAVVSRDGAELHSFAGSDGREVLWQAGPVWPRRAPVLFPIVGKLAGDRLLHRGAPHRMTQHGFARDRRFEWVERGPASCRLALEDDAETRRAYPFAFRFEASYAVDDGALRAVFSVTNTGDEVLPASVGAHPAFRWPLSDGVPKGAHRLEFEAPEPAPVRRLDAGLLAAAAEPSPVVGRTLALSEALFERDALILDRPVSRSVRYAAEDGTAIEVSWSGFAQLGLWSKPGGDFLCIEPWYGTADPVGFGGEFADKPGLLLLRPGERRELEWRAKPCPGPGR